MMSKVKENWVFFVIVFVSIIELIFTICFIYLDSHCFKMSGLNKLVIFGRSIYSDELQMNLEGFDFVEDSINIAHDNGYILRHLIINEDKTSYLVDISDWKDNFNNYKEIEKEIDRYDALLKQLESGFDNLSEKEQLYLMQVMIANNFTYNNENGFNKAINYSRGLGDCVDYAFLVKSLCDRRNIICDYIYVIQQKGNHIFNKVYIDNQWWLVDFTDIRPNQVRKETAAYYTIDEFEKAGYKECLMVYYIDGEMRTEDFGYEKNFDLY